MIGIIGAMKEEVDALLSHLENVSQETILGVDFYKAKHKNVDVVICLSGIGKVNSAVSTTILLSNFKVDKIINIGSAGGVLGNIGDVVVADRTRYFDVDVTAFGYELGQVPGMPAYYVSDLDLVNKTKTILESMGIPAHIGVIASSDSFITKVPEVNAIAFEMEAASIAQVAHKFNTPFVVIRALSDIINGSNHVDFNQFLQTAAKKSAEVVIRLVEQV